MNIRKTVYWLILMMIVSAFPSVCAAENSAYALLSDAEPTVSGMQAEMPLGTSVTTEESGGKTGWVLKPGVANASFVSCKIDNDFIYDLKAEETVEVSVEYLDDSYGGFSIYYDAQGGKRKAEFKQLTNTNNWLTHTFILYDARFANGIDTDDFQIITDGTGKSVDENGVMDTSPQPITISEIRVSKSAMKSPYQITVATGKTGNIFFEGDAISFDISFSCAAVGFGGETVTYKALDFDGNTVFTKTSMIDSGKETLVIPSLKYGVYYLEIEITSGAVSQKETIDFSYSRKADRVNKRFGTNVHYEWEVYNAQDVMDLADLIRNAGYGFTRTSARWNNLETSKGDYQMSENLMTSLQYNDALGLESLIILQCDNPLYDSYPYLMDSDEKRQAYVNFCSWAVKEMSPYTNYFASPNEYNLITGGIHVPEHAVPFTKLVKAAEPAIRTANPDAVIVAGETGGYRPEWDEVCYANGIFDVCDAYSFHTYDYMAEAEYAPTLLNVLQNYTSWVKAKDSTKGAWITEVGWPAENMSAAAAQSMGQSNETAQARRYARSFAMYSNPDLIDKVFHYGFADNYVGWFYSENKFGIVESHEDKTPFAAKPAYIVTAAFNDIVGDAEFKGNMSDKENLYAYKFVNADMEEIMCFWKYDEYGSSGTPTGAEYTYQSDKKYFEVSDMYGNTQYFKNDSGSYTGVYENELVYVKGVDFIKPELSVSAKSIWSLPEDAKTIDVTIQSPNAIDTTPIQIIAAAYDQSGKLIQADVQAQEVGSTGVSIQYPIADFLDMETFKVIAVESMATLRPLAPAAKLSYWGSDAGIRCSQSGSLITVSGRLPGSSAGSDCIITVLSSDVKKETYDIGTYLENLLWSDVVTTDNGGTYRFHFALPDGYDKKQIYIQVSSKDYTGRYTYLIQ